MDKGLSKFFAEHPNWKHQPDLVKQCSDPEVIEDYVRWLGKWVSIMAGGATHVDGPTGSHLGAPRTFPFSDAMSRGAGCVIVPS